MNTPIITLEVTRMRETLNIMIGERAAMIAKEMQDAVDTFCTPERIQAIVQQTAHKILEETIKSEIDYFFRYGAGRAAVKGAVMQALNEQFPDREPT